MERELFIQYSRIVGTGLALATLSSCQIIEDIVDPPAATNEILFEGVGEDDGIFDPSLAPDPDTGRIWMSYSEVAISGGLPENGAVSTRLAWSDDAGERWTDAALVVNAATDTSAQDSPGGSAGTWVHEVSALVHDPGASKAERWKLAWHRYLWIDGQRLFQHGWIGIRTASELFISGGRTLLVATPRQGDDYRGCLVFEVEDMDGAALKRADGIPEVQSTIKGSEGSFHGACGTTAEATSSGVLYGELFPLGTPKFRLFKSGELP